MSVGYVYFYLQRSFQGGAFGRKIYSWYQPAGRVCDECPVKAQVGCATHQGSNRMKLRWIVLLAIRAWYIYTKTANNTEIDVEFG